MGVKYIQRFLWASQRILFFKVDRYLRALFHKTHGRWLANQAKLTNQDEITFSVNIAVKIPFVMQKVYQVARNMNLISWCMFWKTNIWNNSTKSFTSENYSRPNQTASLRIISSWIIGIEYFAKRFTSCRVYWQQYFPLWFRLIFLICSQKSFS